jgi:UDP-N-acetylmuramoyl-tripeptide--D-alanyl-D-alanine ligase
VKNLVPLRKNDLDALFDENSLHNIAESWSSYGVSIDSRSIERGNLFVCLKGENFDAHEKVADAFEKGASASLVESDWFEENKNLYPSQAFIVVKNCLRALGEIAQLKRQHFDIPIIAVAGSNGKTTTKEFISHLLSSQYNVLKTKNNYNNQVGVPLMLLALTEEHQVAVIEIGTSEPGEIDILSRMLMPTHGIITNIGKEHLEKLIDLDGVELEETYLFGYLKKHDGLAFINFDDKRLRKYSRILEKYISFGESEDADINSKIVCDEQLRPSLSFNVNSTKIEAKLIAQGKSFGYSAIAATAIAIHFGISKENIEKGLSSFAPDASESYGRMLFEEIGTNIFINDCYNANPDSMLNALNVLSEIKCKEAGKKIAVLGDMLELGETAIEEHKEIICKALEVADIVFLYGEHFRDAYKQENFFCKNNLNKTAQVFHQKSTLICELKNTVLENDIILVKASRGMKLEEVILGFKN